jgi:hypothetical protein
MAATVSFGIVPLSGGKSHAKAGAEMSTAAAASIVHGCILSSGSFDREQQIPLVQKFQR